MRGKTLKISLDTQISLDSMKYNFLQGEKGHEFEFNIMSSGNSIELDDTDTALVYLEFPDGTLIQKNAIVDGTNNVIKYTMVDDMTVMSGTVLLQIEVLNSSGDVIAYTRPTSYVVDENKAFSGNTPVTNVPNLRQMRDSIVLNTNDINTMKTAKISSDGSINMDTGYTPNNGLAVATKDYVDANSGKGGSDTFVGLTDTPSNIGAIGQVLQVGLTGDLAFEDLPKQGLPQADQDKLDNITVTNPIDLDVVTQDINAVEDRTNGVGYDTTNKVTTLAHDIVLDNDQADVTDFNKQGRELASTDRVQDMIDKKVGSGSSIVIGDNAGEAFDGARGKYLEDSLGIPLHLPDVLTVNITTVETDVTVGSTIVKHYVADATQGTITQSDAEIPLQKVEYYDDGTDTTIEFCRPAKVHISKAEFVKGGTIVATLDGTTFGNNIDYDITQGAYKETMVIKGHTVDDLTTNSKLDLQVKKYDMAIYPVVEDIKDIADNLAVTASALGTPQNLPEKLLIDIAGTAQSADPDGIVKYIATGSAIVQSNDKIGLDRVEYWKSKDETKTYITFWRPIKIEVLGTVKIGDPATAVEINNSDNFNSLVSYDPTRGAYKEEMIVDAKLDDISGSLTNLHVETDKVRVAPLIPAIAQMEDGLTNVLSRNLISLYGMGTQADADALTANDGQEGDLFFVLDTATK